uniref:Uncharacterized protein n=1 Tax=Timema douglasi TaxID=61478 RepID=A0A7R8VY41_TIMDO|nr:unnamed protein product [Timema douglasi]
MTPGTMSDTTMTPGTMSDTTMTPGTMSEYNNVISNKIVAYTSTRSNPATDDEVTLILNEMDFDYNSAFER